MISLDEYFAARPHKPNVADRIARLNPNGIEEGCMPRGWNPKRTFKYARVMSDIVSISEFKAKWGDHALMWLKIQNRLVNLGGKRRAVTAMDFYNPFRF